MCPFNILLSESKNFHNKDWKMPGHFKNASQCSYFSFCPVSQYLLCFGTSVLRYVCLNYLQFGLLCIHFTSCLYGGVVYASVVLPIKLYDVLNDDMWVTYSDSGKEGAHLSSRQFHS